MADSSHITMDVSSLQKPVNLHQVTPLVSCKLTPAETYRLASSGMSKSKVDDTVDDLSNVNVHHRLYDSCAGDDVNDNFEFDEYDDEYVTDVHFDPPPRYAAGPKLAKDNCVETSAQNGTFDVNHVQKCSVVSKSGAEDYCDSVSTCDGLPDEPPFGYPPCADRLMSSAIGLLENSNTCQHRHASPPALADENDASPSSPPSCPNGINGVTLFDGAMHIDDAKPIEVHDVDQSDSSCHNYISATLRSPPTTESVEFRQTSVPRRRPNKHSSTRMCSIPKSDSAAENTSYNIDEAVRFINGDSNENAQDNRRIKSSATKVSKSSISSKGKTKQHATSSGDDGPGHASSIGSPEDSAESLPSPDENLQSDSSHKSKSATANPTVENDITKEEYHIVSSDHISVSISADNLNATSQTTDGEFTDVVRRKRKDVVGQRKQLRPASNHCMPEQPRAIHRVGNGLHEIEQHTLDKSAPTASGPDRTMMGTGDATSSISLDPDHLAAFPALPSRSLRRNSTGNLPAVPESNHHNHSDLIESAERPTAFQKPFTSSYASIVVARLPKIEANNCKSYGSNSSEEPKPAEDEKSSEVSNVMMPSLVTMESSGMSNETVESTSVVNSAVENDKMLSTAEPGLHSDCADDFVTMDAGGVDHIPAVAVTLSVVPPCANELPCNSDNQVPGTQDQSFPDYAISSGLSQSKSSCVPQVLPASYDQLASSTSHKTTSQQPTSTSKNVPRPSHPVGSDDAIVFLDTRSKTDHCLLSNSWGITFWYDDKNDSAPTKLLHPPSDATAGGTEQPVTLDFLQQSAVEMASSESTAIASADDRMQTRGSFDVRTAQRFLLNAFYEAEDSGPGVLLRYGIDLQ